MLASIIFIYSGFKNGFLYSGLELLLTISVGFVFETFNITINQHYSYPNSFFYIGKVPISILVGWYIIFMFGKFWSIILLAIISSLKKQKTTSIFTNISLIPIIILLTAYIASTMVLLIDPLATRLKWWEWYEPAPYLDVPIGEIYGIFFASCLIGIVFWGVFYYFEIDTSVSYNRLDILMVICYELLCVILLLWSIDTSTSNNDVLIGSSVIYIVTQLPVVFISLIYIFSDDYTLLIEQEFFKFRIINYTGYVISLILFIMIFFSMDLLIPLNTGIISIHMILIQFFFLVTLFNIHLTLKIKEISNQN